ncbi:protein phosphatase 2C domain-containing protein [Streptomyces sp. b94]|uniref:protein phosphatase 2C domain-containing protein n=1 Tax=Streptomyces sp. b94 TaxID=1827634 RepID=UPI001B35920C|nr:protein phosphatase 2C domain-containing protein [Streptomyces sp. b94]MBQ1099528.1 protein phosphatase 2C domain-containing protein [Streptomyces sp. b94]
MSQQGGTPTGRDDDWWGQLYDDSTGDTGPTAAPDSLDDRFASAAGTVGRRPDHGTTRGTTSPANAVDPAQAAKAPPPPPPAAGPAQAGDDPHPPPAGRPWSGGDRTPPAAPDHSAERSPSPAADRPPWWAAAEPSDIPVPRTAPSASPQPGVSPPVPPVTGPVASVAREPGLPPSAPQETDPPPSAPLQPGPAPSASPRPDPQQPDPHQPAQPQPARRPGPHGLTTSGTGPADLTEPPDPTLPAGRSAPGTPPPPPRAAPGLPPLPPPFLASQPPESLPAPSRDGVGEVPSVARDFVGSGPPTYDAEPTALPSADPDGLDGLVADTVLDGARYGTCTLRAVSVRGDSARYRGDPRRDALLVARFGAGEQALVLVAMATGARATAGAHRAAAEVCQWIGRAVGRSHARLAEDLRAARRGELKSGLHRLTDRSLGRLRAGAAEQGLAPDEYAATLRCLLLPADPECRTRVFFGAGAGGLLRLRDGAWQDMEPGVGEVAGEPVVGFGSARRAGPGGTPDQAPEGDRLTMDLGITAPPGPYDGPPAEPSREPFRFRTSIARPGDVLLMCTAGLAEPLLNEPELGGLLARRWAGRTPPGLAEFLTDSRVRVKGYADDRTAAAVWEA